MNRETFLATIIRWYIAAPDTPSEPSRRDWAIATSIWQQRVPIKTAELAIKLASVRRHLRSDDLGPLEPIRSLGYFRPLAIQLAERPPKEGYAEHISHHYRKLIAKSAAKPRDYSAS